MPPNPAELVGRGRQPLADRSALAEQPCEDDQDHHFEADEEEVTDCRGDDRPASRRNQAPGEQLLREQKGDQAAHHRILGASELLEDGVG